MWINTPIALGSNVSVNVTVTGMLDPAEAEPKSTEVGEKEN
jgi:hypothetical protein